MKRIIFTLFLLCSVPAFAQGKININTATQVQLESLNDIGPVLAARIIAGRPYSKIEDIQKVKGIKVKLFAKIQGSIVTK